MIFKRKPNEEVVMTEVPTENLELRAPCPACFGTGRVLTVNDLLRQSLLLLGQDDTVHQKVVATFYRDLLADAPDLAPLFPDDLTDPKSDGAGKVQRDRLLAALIALGQSYDPDNVETMGVLDTHLATFGRAHAAFRRPDGTVRGASVLEYTAVWESLAGVLEELEGWERRFTVAWQEAYEYAAARMIAAQVATEPGAFGRFPRV